MSASNWARPAKKMTTSRPIVLSMSMICPPRNWITMTRTPRVANRSNVSRMSLAVRPSRSSFVTTNTSPAWA